MMIAEESTARIIWSMNTSQDVTRGLYGGANAIKSRLLPLLGSGYFGNSISLGSNVFVPGSTNLKVRDQDNLKQTLEKLELELSAIKRDNAKLRTDLLKMEAENERLKSQLIQPNVVENGFNETGAGALKISTNLSKNYKDSEIGQLSLSAPPDLAHSALSGISPLSINDPVQRYRQQILVMRFNELFSNHRIEAMGILRRYIDDHDMNQRILFYTMLEAFSVTKSAFRSYRNRVRTQLNVSTIATPNDNLDELVQSHINVHGSHSADFNSLIQDVCSCLERRVPRIRRPSQAMGFEVINEFIHEACKLAWECAALAHPLDVCRPVCENELIDESKYRRSHDSTYPTLLIHHHIWPCLMQGDRIMVKGEVCTRGANLSGNYGYELGSAETLKSVNRMRNRISSRSCSPIRLSYPPGKGKTSRFRKLQSYSAHEFKQN